ncbi:MAG: NAD-dependent oxidoreductase [Parcubacteria bacterium C7867-006]|nr:MAG: NAD-dependent oxidoreductase [Parcubacteria bacterium C7867-006]
MKYIDNFLNGITMYKIVLYGLTILSLVAIVLGFFGVLPYSGVSLISTLLVLFAVCFVTNQLFSSLFKVQTNVESVWISSYMASKYLLTIDKKHIFNPVAVSIFLIGLFGSGIASWWVATSSMVVPVSILGFLVLRKLKRFQMFFAFVLASLVSILIFNFSSISDIVEILKITFISGPILFFGSIMLTEPLTTPPTKKLQIMYAVITGFMFGAQFEFGILYSTPGLALVIGNIFSYIVSPRARLVLTLIQKRALTKDVYEFEWKLDQKFNFKSGQYLEWTLGHKNPDQRGNRRYFTIASSPTEENLKLGVKFYNNSSSFKKKLGSLNAGDKIIASQLSGEFILPEDKNKKLVFIAGGIGITPFRSMVKNLLDFGQNRDIVLFFSNRTPTDIVYKDIFDQAKVYGLKTIYAVNDLAGTVIEDDMKIGFVDEKMIRDNVPDFADRMFYISGPHGMITAFESTLAKMGVKSSNIKTDFFPGFV